MFNEDVLDFHHIKEQLQQHCSSTIAKELFCILNLWRMLKLFKRTLMKRRKPCVLPIQSETLIQLRLHEIFNESC
ncbi:MAG: hypothetical protein ACLUPK_02430, partial [Veillonella sp.]